MGHYDGQNYYSSVSTFLDSDEDKEDLEKEINELKAILKTIIECLKSKNYHDPTMRYAREEAERLLGY